MLIATLLFLDKFFAVIALKSSPLGYFLEYVRYSAAGIVIIFLAPLLFTRIGLAASEPE
jgi:hypothetical protein